MLLTLVLGWAGSASATPSAGAPSVVTADPPPGATVLIGTGGLTWSDVTEKGTPNLWALLRNGSGGAMSIRSVLRNTCPVDGWLGLSAGARAAAEREGPSQPCPPLPEVPTAEAAPAGSDPAAAGAAPAGAVAVPGWAAYVTAATTADFSSRLGTLGDAAAAGEQCVSAIGPGAGIAAARSDGTVAHWTAWSPEALVRELNSCPISIVDVGALREDVAAGETVPSGSRAQQLSAIDDKIGLVVAAAPGGADVIAASLADAGVQERLRLVVAKGPHFGPGQLRSTSTRQDGLVQAQDLTVTVLSAQGLTVPDSLGGAPLTFAAEGGNTVDATRARLTHLVDYDEASHKVHSLVPPFFNTFAYGQLVAYLVVLLVWRGKLGSESSRLRVLRWIRVLAVCAASVPASTFLANLVPWWRFSMPMVSVVASVLLFVALIAGLALAGPWGRTAWGPMLVVAGVTMGVLAADVMTGSRLQLSSLMGLQPVVAGRFYGMGNVTFAIFVTASLLLATALSSLLVRARGPRVAALLVVLIGAATVVIDGAPFWGADGGGPPATIPGFAFLTLSILGIAMTWKRALAIGAACVALFLGVGLLDWLRAPSDRTHLGRFIQSIIDGGALDIVKRKALQNWDILTGNAPLTLLVPAALLFVIYVLARPTSWGSRALQRSFQTMPTLRAGLIALVVTLTIGFLINDSGTAIPAVGATVAVPLIVAVAVSALAEESRAKAPTRAARRRG